MIVILGGGISGLSAAYQLKKAGKAFLLLEQKEHLGGIINSTSQNDFVLESGPNTVLVNNKETKELIEDLDLWKHLIFPDEEAAKSRFVLKKGKIEALPTGLAAAIKSPLIKWSTLFSILKEPFIKKANGSTEESLAQFTKRRLGNQIFEDFVTPFVTGIYAGDPEKMNINYTLNILKEAEQEYGSILKGMPRIMKKKKKINDAIGLPKQKIFSFKNGLNELIKAIESAIQEHVQLKTSIQSIEKLADQYKINYLSEGIEKCTTATHVISCLPAYSLSAICSKFAPSLSNKLNEINYVPAVVMHFAVPKDQIKFKKKAFGILSRKEEKVPFLGILFNSRFFPHTAPNDMDLITVIAGGSRYPELIKKGDEEIKDEIINCIQPLLNIKGDLELLNLQKWQNAIPQYEMNYTPIENEIESFLKEHPNFYIASNFYKGISVSDCIKNAIHLTASKDHSNKCFSILSKDYLFFLFQPIGLGDCLFYLIRGIITNSAKKTQTLLNGWGIDISALILFSNPFLFQSNLSRAWENANAFNLVLSKRTQVYDVAM